MSKRKPPRNDAQIDLFAPIFNDIAARDGIDMMEFPFFSLSKKKRFEPLIYNNEARGIEIIVSAGKPHGMATIWDKDILIWCISQVREALDRGEQPNKRIHFHPYHLLKAIRRGQGKTEYDLLRQAIKRLHNTSIYTTIRNSGKRRDDAFHWIEQASQTVDEETGEANGMWWIELPTWIYQAAITKHFVLTLDDDYFLLMGGRERRLYLIARKHGGYQDAGFTMPMTALYKKMGTEEEYKYWARAIREIVKEDQLPGYHLEIFRNSEGDEYINFTRRSNLAFSHPAYKSDIPRAIKKAIS
jgi:plasmid replication initiation protein